MAHFLLYYFPTTEAIQKGEVPQSLIFPFLIRFPSISATIPCNRGKPTHTIPNLRNLFPPNPYLSQPQLENIGPVIFDGGQIRIGTYG